jgi:hypothetical protein
MKKKAARLTKVRRLQQKPREAISLSAFLILHCMNPRDRFTRVVLSVNDAACRRVRLILSCA